MNMTSSRSAETSKAEKPEEDTAEYIAEEKIKSGSTSSGRSGEWGVKSARAFIHNEESKVNSDSDKSSVDETHNMKEVPSETVYSTRRHRTRDRNQSESNEQLQSTRSTKRKEKLNTTTKKNVKKKFPTAITGPSLQDLSEDLENMEFVNLKDLPNLPRIDSDIKGHFVGSNHKFERPITGFYIRVRLLKYPAFAEKAKWPGDLVVLEDRVFSWQEKVFSKWEMEKYSDKKALKTDLDHFYYNELQSNPNSAGIYLHSYVDSDYFITAQERRTLIKKCAAFHVKGPQKHPEFSPELKSLNSDGESVYELDSDSEVRPLKRTIAKSLTDEEELKVAEKLEKDKARRKKIEEELEIKQQKETEKMEDKKRQEILKLTKKQTENDEKLFKLEDFYKAELEAKDKLLQKYIKSKRPSVAISATLLSTYSSPSITSQSRSKKSSDKLQKKTDENDSDVNSNKKSKKNLDERVGSSSSKTGMESQKIEGHQQIEDNGEYEELVKVKESKIKRMPSPQQIATVIKPSRPVWRVTRRRFSERSAFQSSPQCMYIMASIPQLKRRKREIPVCVIKAYQKSGLVVLKPPFGYRIIEAKRNHVYRLSWELHKSHTISNVQSKSKSFKQLVGKIKSNERVFLTNNTEKGTLEEMGALFEIVSMNEMRIVVLGEIVSAEKFVTEPICLHYVVEIPKGWRNDSISSNLQGTTNSSYITDDCVAHFSHSFFFQLAFSMDSVEFEDTYLRPMILFMVVSIGSSGRILYEGYGYISIPSTPGSHLIQVQTWKPKSRSTVEKMQQAFLGVNPSLQDIHAVHIPILENEECKLANRLGLQSEPSGLVKFRLNVIHQTPTSYRDEESKLDLLEKMSSATILKSVQVVIDAFHRARKRATLLKSH